VRNRAKLSWIIVGGITSLLVVSLLIFPHRQGGISGSASSSPAVIPSTIVIDNRDERSVQSAAALPKEAKTQTKELLAPTLPPLDKAMVEINRRLAAGLNAESRERTRKLYAVVFQQLALPADLQVKAIDILTQQEQQLEQQAFEAAQSGNIPVPPSPEEMQMQRAQRDSQLRTVLGDPGFAQFNQYQTTIPDRIIIDEMNQQGANLSENQSAGLLQVLTESRQQILGQAGSTPNLNSMPPDQAIAAMQRQQDLLQQTVSDRVQSLLTPDQGKMLQGAISQLNIVPQGP
jgi:hypothetical protein